MKEGKPNENPKQMQSVQNKTFKWFDWHWSPEEPIKLRSIVEIVAFILIVVFCGFLYYRWNVVPKRELDIRVEDLSNGKVYYYGECVDSVRRVMACDIKCCIPMTTHNEFVKDTSDVSIRFSPIYSSEDYSDFLRISFIKDSIRNIKDSSAYSRLLKLQESCQLRKEEYIFVQDYAKNVNKELTALRNVLVDSFNLAIDSNVVMYNNYNMSLPYFSGYNYEKTTRKPQGIMFSECDKAKALLKFSGYQWDHASVADISCDENMARLSYSSSSRARSKEHWSDWFNIYNPFRGGAAMETPKWFRLEDISQAYIDINISSLTIDSITLTMDFVGVTEFSSMNPMPDEIDMSKIVFRDPVKLYQIRNNGLRFHARFKELENRQQIRVFSVTAVMSAFVLVFVVFLISAYFKLRKKFGNVEKVRLLFWVLKVILLSIALYCVLYWTFMYLVVDDESILTVNIIVIPLLILILMIIDKRLRNRFFAKKNAGRTIKYYSIFIFVIVLSWSSYTLFTMDIEKSLSLGKYGRATQLLYDKILSEDSVSSIDYYKLRKALLGEKPFVTDSAYTHFEVDLQSNDSILLLEHEDTLLIFDIKRDYYQRFILPTKHIAAYIKEPFIHILHYANDFLINYNKNPYSLIKVPGRFDYSFNNGTTIVSHSQDTVFYSTLSNNKLNIVNTQIYTGLDGEIRQVLDNFLVVDNNPAIYEMINGKAVVKYKSTDGPFTVINPKERLLKTNHQYCYIDSKGKIKVDSTVKSIIYCNDYSVDKYLSFDKIKLTRSVLQKDNSREFLGLDTTYLYFLKSESKKVEVYDVRHGDIPIDSFYVECTPQSYRHDNGLYFVCHWGGVYVYNHKGLLYKKPYVYGTNYWKGYVSNIVDGKMMIYSVVNPSDSFRVKNSKFFNEGRYLVCSGWIYDTDYLEHISYIENIESIDALLSRTKYLRDKQKKKLRDKLKKWEHKWN